MKFILILFLLAYMPPANSKLECIRWTWYVVHRMTWYGDSYTRESICLDWVDKEDKKKQKKKT
jgi:hypothetical protein